MNNRRDFMKLLGGALGAGAAAGLAPGRTLTALAASPMPSGYRFFRLVTTGMSLPGGRELQYLTGPTLINDRNQVLFAAQDTEGATGIYRYQLETDGYLFEVSAMEEMVREGDTLSDGEVVRAVFAAATNDQGGLGMLIQTEDSRLNAVYTLQDGQLVPVAAYRTQVPGQDHRFGANISDITMANSGELLVVSHYTTEGVSSPRQGLFYLPSGTLDSDTQILLTTPALISGSESLLDHLGLSHSNRNGDYIIQVATHQNALTAEGAAPAARTVLVQGRVDQPADPELITTARVIDHPAGQVTTSGEVIYGPRVDPGGRGAYVVHVTGDDLELIWGDEVVAATGQTAMANWQVGSLAPPIVSPAGVLYYLLIGANQWQLIAYNGSTRRVVASLLDQIEGASLVHMLWGLTTDQINSREMMVFMGEFSDDSQSIVLGLPI